MEDIIIRRLYKYGLTLIKRDERTYFLSDIETGECYSDMSIYYIMELINSWSKMSTFI